MKKVEKLPIIQRTLSFAYILYVKSIRDKKLIFIKLSLMFLSILVFVSSPYIISGFLPVSLAFTLVFLSRLNFYNFAIETGSKDKFIEALSSNFPSLSKSDIEFFNLAYEHNLFVKPNMYMYVTTISTVFTISIVILLFVQALN